MKAIKKNEIVKLNKRPSNFKDLTGLVFGRLTVLGHEGSEIVSTNPIKKKSVWLVKCECGNEFICRGADLGKKTISCGCYSRQRTIEFNKATKTKESYCAFSDVWQSYKCGAKKRGYTFELTKDQFLSIVKNNCTYCGNPPSCTRKSRTKGNIPSFLYNGIDRVNNEYGYILSNCVPCCNKCNKMKGTMSVDEFKNKIKEIYLRIN